MTQQYTMTYNNTETGSDVTGSIVNLKSPNTP